MKTISDLTTQDFENCIDAVSNNIPIPIDILIQKVEEFAKKRYNDGLVSNDFIQDLNGVIGADHTELGTAILNNINGKLHE
jgi:hypothetical protein